MEDHIGRNSDENTQRSSAAVLVGLEDIQAGYVHVVADEQVAPRRNSSSVQVRVVSPSAVDAAAAIAEVAVVIPQAHAEDLQSFPSPRRRGTPTAAAASRRQQQRHRVTYEDLLHRPRSNPRSRTPMRYESPLEHGAFRRDTTRIRRDDSSSSSFQARTVSIRPTAGLGVGVVRSVPERAHFDDTNTRPQPISLTTTKSLKQGPSQRKTRRWNNDNFVNTQHDLSHSSSARARAAAEILAAAKADARHFLPVYDPAEHQRSAQVTAFMQDAKYSTVRDQFFQGELHASSLSSHQESTNKTNTDKNPTPADLYQRIDPRLRRVVAKACENSAPACKIVESFEKYLVHVFDAESNNNNNSNNTNVECDFGEDVLLEKPTVNTKLSSDGKTKTTVTFLFDGTSPSGGFHRLLVHAVSHFHGLHAKTSTLETTPITKSSRSNYDDHKGEHNNNNNNNNTETARALMVQGTLLRGSQFQLLDHLAFLQQQKQRQRQ